MAYLSHSPLIVAQGGTGLVTITAHNLIVGNGTSAPNLVAPSSTSGVPVVSQGSSSDPAYGTAVVAGGGTGNTTFTAYSVVCAGTTATGIFQNVSGVGSSGNVLTSNGASALPTWQAAASSSILTVTAITSSSSPYTVLTTDQFIAADPTSGVISVLLPNAPTTGRVIYVKDSTGQGATHNITVTTVGGSVNIDGATSYVMNTAFQSVSLVFDGTAYEIF